MSKAHFFDLDAEWPTFLAHLRKGCDTPRVPFMAPDLPPHFVQRPVGIRRAEESAPLTADRGQPVAITTALTGAGGFGKTTLATALCHDDDILENFDDGILWVTLGQTPNMSGRPAHRLCGADRRAARFCRCGRMPRFSSRRSWSNEPVCW